MSQDVVRFKGQYWYYENLDRDDKLYIYVGGRTEDNKTVFLRIDRFTPYIYLELPQRVKWNKTYAREVFEYFKDTWGLGMKNYALMNKKILHYNKPVKVLCITFRSLDGIKKFRGRIRYKNSKHIYPINGRIIRGNEFKVHEDNIDPIIKLTGHNNIQLANWIEAKKSDEDYELEDDESSDKDFQPTSDIGWCVNYQDIKPIPPPKKSIVPPTYISFDIECYSVNHNAKLPNSEESDNVVFQISMIYGTLGKPIEKKMLLTLFDIHSIEGVEVLKFKSESDLLMGFRAQVIDKDPDIFITYNGMKFDWEYIINRAKKLGIIKSFVSRMGRMENDCEIKEATWTSGAYGKQKFKYVECYGRTNVDVLLEIERNYKLPLYNLNTVSQKFLKEEKDDITPRELFILYKITADILPHLKVVPSEDKLVTYRRLINKIMEERKIHGVVKELKDNLLKCSSKKFKYYIREALTITGRYCVQDTVLPIRLVEKLNLWITMEEMSNVTHVPPSYLHTRGQQVKVMAQLYRETLKKNFIIPFRTEEDNAKDMVNFQGAVVIEAKPGYYTNIATLDFASLYPTTMIAKNICFTTILEENDPYPDHLCHIVEFTEHIGCEHDPQKRDRKKDKILCGHQRHRFKKVIITLLEDGTIIRENEGILPRLERDLLGNRKIVKKEMFKTEARLKMQLGQADQDDIKYYRKMGWEIIQEGSLGKNETMMLDVMVNVLNAKQLALKVSANSVVPNTPIPCRIDGVFQYKTIEELSNGDWKDDEENSNQFSSPIPKLEVWSDVGFTPVKYVMRHPLNEKDKLTRVLTHTGCVDCTEDHSLLTKDKVEIEPCDLKIGDELFHKEVPLPEDTPETPIYRSISDQDIKEYKIPNVTHNNINAELAFCWGFFFAEKNKPWEIRDRDLDKLERVKDLLTRNEINHSFKISKSAGVYYLRPTNSSVQTLTKKYKNLFYDQRGDKKIPNIILNSQVEIRQSFLLGYYSGNNNQNIVSGQIGAVGLIFLIKSLGYKVSVNFSKDNVYYLRLCDEIKDVKLVKEISKISDNSNEYVYDIETESHHFAAGVGDMIVHNSQYGALGTKQGSLSMVKCAAAVTASGRDLIMSAIDKIKKVYSNAILVYGDTDSCMIKFDGCDVVESFRIGHEASRIVTHYLKCQIIGVDENFTVEVQTTGEKFTLNNVDMEKHYPHLSYENKIKVIEYNDNPIDLEFENLYGEFFLLTKKRYIAYSYNKEGKVIAVVKKGVVLKRRDNCNKLKKTYEPFSDGIMSEKSEREILWEFYDNIQMMFTCQVPDEDYIIYLGVKDIKEYTTNKRNQVEDILDENGKIIDFDHDVNNEDIKYNSNVQTSILRRLRTRGNILPPNTRIEYVYLEERRCVHDNRKGDCFSDKCNKKNHTNGEKAEDFLYYKENKKNEGLRIDEIHYLDVQLSKPIYELYSVRFPKGNWVHEKLDQIIIQFFAKVDGDIIKNFPEPNLESYWNFSIDEFGKYQRIISQTEEYKKKSYQKTEYIFGDKKRLDILDVPEEIDEEDEYSENESNLIVPENKIEEEKNIKYRFKYIINKGIDSRIEYLLNNIREGDPYSLDPNKDKEVINLFKRWRAKRVLDKYHKDFGLPIRQIRRSKGSGTKYLRKHKKKKNVIFVKNYKSFERGTTGRVVEVNKEENTYKILIDSKKSIFAEEVPREFIHTYYVKQSKMMEDMVNYRKAYRNMIIELQEYFDELVDGKHTRCQMMEGYFNRCQREGGRKAVFVVRD